MVVKWLDFSGVSGVAVRVAGKEQRSPASSQQQPWSVSEGG